VQMISLVTSGDAVSAISGAYSTTNFIQANNGSTMWSGYGAAANSTTGTAPTWTFASNSLSGGSAVAILETTRHRAMVVHSE
jgi:hypothetical protein